MRDLLVRTPPASEVYTQVLDFFRGKDALPVPPDVHLRVLRGVGVEWDEHRFLGRESESVYLHKVDHPVHSFLEQFHALFHPRAVCVETSDVGVRPYRQVIGVHGQYCLSFHCRVHVVDLDVEQQGADHRPLRNAHTYSFGGRRGSLPPDLHRSVAQEGYDVVVHVARNSDLAEFL